MRLKILLYMFLGMALTACSPVIPPAYYPVLPALPPAWETLLGQPLWRVEWYDADGSLRHAQGDAASLPAMALSPGLVQPVLAHPSWPGMPPGTMRPAGAIFPHDAEDSQLVLSWEGGVEAAFYQALNRAALAAETEGQGKQLRQGAYFDWPRFRALMGGGDLPGGVQEDPWLVDWQSVAEKTVQSGFDRRRIKVQAREELAVAIPSGGPWIGASPFAAPLPWQAGETVRIGVNARADTYASPGGVLRCTRGAWVWLPW